MTSTNSSDKSNKRKQIIDYANKLNAVLSAKKKISILESNIWSNFKELEFLKHSIDQKSKGINETIIAIQEIEPELSKIREKYSKIETEKEALETKYKRLLDIQNNLDRRKSDIAKSRLNISQLHKDIQTLQKQVNSLEQQNQKSIIKKEASQKLLADNIKTFNKLNKEVETYRNTNKLMQGFKTESIDDYHFEILVPHNDNVESYRSEATETINKVVNEIAAMKELMDRFASLESELNSSINELETKVNTFKAQGKPDIDKSSLQLTIDGLKEQQNILIKNIDKNKEIRSQLTSDLNSTIERLEQEKELEGEIVEKIQYMQRRKAEMDQLENIEQAMGDLQKQIDINRGYIRKNNHYLTIVNLVSQKVEELNSYLTKEVETYLSKFNTYLHILLLKHHL
ncbi:MAG: hypothetical protein HQK64_00210 [Desulfamplus sp.]|nr:hypothetical protein [Desulfamplus sp.]MBF0388979.1 hypothetical protein [Desulfamplus sp.]